MADRRTGKARQGTHPTTPRPEMIGGHKALYKTSSGQAAQKVISNAAKNGQRIELAVVDKRGHVHRVIQGHHGRGGGASATWVKQGDKRAPGVHREYQGTGKTAASLKGSLAHFSEQGDPAKSDKHGRPIDPDDIKEIQIKVYL